MLDYSIIERYKEFILSRKGIIPNKVKVALESLLEANKEVEEVYLIGSYANGDYTDENTPKWVIEFKKSFGKSNKLSDIDFFTIPQVPSTNEYDINSFFRKNAILIYKNNKILI